MVRKWLLPLSCLGLLVISMLPPYTAIAYDPRNTQDVISSILRASIEPYRQWGWIFHIATFLLVAYILWQPGRAGRVLAIYFGVNYLIIAAIQTHAVTEKYGFALHTGAMVGTLAMAITWLAVAVKNGLELSLQKVPAWGYFLLPFATLAFWSPITIQGESILPNFDPRLLITSADYGLTYCFVTPVFLYLLILFSTNVASYAFRLSAFNALLYGLFNLTHWFNPNTVWMGAMHLPLMIISMVAIFLPSIKRGLSPRPMLNPK